MRRREKALCRLVGEMLEQLRKSQILYCENFCRERVGAAVESHTRRCIRYRTVIAKAEARL